jgi:hypothetical protein
MAGILFTADYQRLTSADGRGSSAQIRHIVGDG